MQSAATCDHRFKVLTGKVKQNITGMDERHSSKHPCVKKPDSSYINDGGRILRAGAHKKMRSHEKEEEGRRDDNECAGSIDRGGATAGPSSVSLSLHQLQNVGLTATMAMDHSNGGEEIGLASIIFKWVKT